jgi:hypothetical protein
MSNSKIFFSKKAAIAAAFYVVLQAIKSSYLYDHKQTGHQHRMERTVKME